MPVRLYPESMLLYAAAIYLVLGQAKDSDLETKVTFTCVGAAVPQLVQQLSQTAHVPMMAPRAFQSDIVVVRAKDARLKDLMDRIADLSAGTWEQKPEGYVLVRSGQKLRAEESDEYAHQVEMFQKSIDKQKKALATLEPWSEQTAKTIAFGLMDTQKTGTNGSFDGRAWQRIQGLDEKAPGGRAIGRVLANLEAKDLAALPTDYKIVFSDRPNRLQRQLPASVVPALSDLVAEQNLWSDVANRIIGDQAGGLYSSAAWMKKSFRGEVGKILLTVSKSINNDNINANIELIVADRKGSVIVRSNRNLNTYGSDNEFKMPTPEAGEQEIPPSPMAAAAKGIYMSESGDRKPLAKELLNQILNPEKFEPLAIGSGDMLVKMATMKNVNLVAALPDDSFTMGLMGGMQKVTPSMLLKLLTLFMNVKQSDGWVSLSSKLPATARSERVDRVILGNYLRAVYAKGHATLDDAAAYAMAVPGQLWDSLGFQMSMLATKSQQGEYFDANMLRFYAQLTPIQRQTLARGASIPLAGLQPSLMELVNKMVFGENSNLQPIQDQSQPLNAEDWDSFYNGLSREPTELFAQGLPNNSSLKLKDSSSKVLVAQPSPGQGGVIYGNQDMSPDDVAQALYAKERPGIFPWLDQQPAFDERKFLCGSRRTLDFTFEFGKVATLQQALQDVAFDSEEPVPYARVPSEFQKAVDAKLAEMRKQYANIKPGQFGNPTGGQATPPPPRQ